MSQAWRIELGGLLKPEHCGKMIRKLGVISMARYELEHERKLAAMWTWNMGTGGWAVQVDAALSCRLVMPP